MSYVGQRGERVRHSRECVRHGELYTLASRRVVRISRLGESPWSTKPPKRDELARHLHPRATRAVYIRVCPITSSLAPDLGLPARQTGAGWSLPGFASGNRCGHLSNQVTREMQLVCVLGCRSRDADCVWCGGARGGRLRCRIQFALSLSPPPSSPLQSSRPRLWHIA